MELNKQEIEFLRESNAIESEYSEEALEDAKHAWNFAKRHMHNKIDIEFIKLIHQELMRRLDPRIAGKIRKIDVWVGGECRSQNKNEIISQLKELCDMWNKDKDSLKKKRKQDKECFVKRWHIFYELCHGFEDGNGRSGRILLNLQRLYLGLPILIIHTGSEQYSYYSWFKRKRGFLWDYQKEEILKDYQNGVEKSIKEIAREMNIYPQIISNFLRENKVIIKRKWNSVKMEKNPNWKGGKKIIKGYIHSLIPNHHLARKDGYVPEHRFIMEQKIKRPLLKEEVVHHKDGNKLNNSPKNLGLLNNNSIHIKKHIKDFQRDELGRFKIKTMEEQQEYYKWFREE